MNKLTLSVVIASVLASAGAVALQGNGFDSITSANDAGANVGWDVEADGGLVLKGDNNMESTLTVSNTRDAGGEKAPVLKVEGRNEKKALNEARPLLRINSIENQAGIELTTGERTKAAGGIFGWTLFNDGGDLILREIKAAGNWTNTAFYRLEERELLLAAGGSVTAQVLVPYCPVDKNGNQTVTAREKENLVTCP